jgi:hypothetical protein
MRFKATIITLGAFLCLFLFSACDGRVGGPLSPPFGSKYREAWFGKGVVLTLTNQSDKVLYDISVKVEGKNGHTATTQTKDSLSPNDSMDVGWMELSSGTIEVGDTISVYADLSSKKWRGL